jgi:hypothetical membrane protein
MDQQFIELFDVNQVWEIVDRKYVPNWNVLGNYISDMFINLIKSFILNTFYDFIIGCPW